MNNLQKFDNTIEELGKELIKLKDTSEAYQKLQGLVISYAKINEQFTKNSKSFEDFATQQQQKQVELAKGIINLQEDIKQLIENERYRIKEIFETELSRRTEEVLSKQKGLQITLWIIGFILTALNIAILVKTFR